MEYRFELEPYRGMATRYTCPQCNKHKTFTRYIDTQTGEHLASHAGKCSRLEQCGYHHPPREFFKACPDYKPANNNIMKTPPPPKHFDTIPQFIVAGTLRGYDKNNFSMFLARMFGAAGAIHLIEKYRIGCAKYWPGATIFWQIDNDDKARTGKIMLYNNKNCRRVKEPFAHITWAHKLVGKSESRESQESQESRTVGKSESRESREEAASAPAVKAAANHLSDFRSPGLSDFTLKQCLFGEHLLKLEPFKTVAIAESEKTAIIASMYLPNYIWLAAGSMEGLTVEKCKVLAGRTVRLYPDVNAYAKWHTTARQLNTRIPTATFVVDNSLTQKTTAYDRQRGVDIADKWIDDKLLEWEQA